MTSLLFGSYVASRRLVERGLVGALCQRLGMAMVVFLSNEGSVAESRLVGLGPIGGSSWPTWPVAPVDDVELAAGVCGARQNDSSHGPEIL